MKILYEGVDITDRVRLSSCEVRDACGGRCDSALIAFEDSGRWFSWQPQVDDAIELEH